MKRSEGTSAVPRTSVVRSDVVIRRADPERFRFVKSGNVSSAEKKANRKSSEYPQRRIYDACILDAVVKKSFSFDQRCDGEIISKIVEDRLGKSPTSARKVQLTYYEDGDKTCVGKVLGKNYNPSLCNGVSEKPFRKALRSTLVGIFGNNKPSATKSCVSGPFAESGSEVRYSEGDSGRNGDSQPASGAVSERPLGLVSGVRRGVRGARGPRCRSTPPPWGPDRAAAPLRLCRTWYAGYGPLIDDQDNFIQKKSSPSATVAACGARRRAEGRRRRAPLTEPPGRLSASSTSLNLLPRISAAVIPLRRKDSHLSRSATPLLDRVPSVLSLGQPAGLVRKDLARSAAPLLERDSSGSLVPAVHHSPTIRKCETVLALTGLEEPEPQRPVNRLRLGSGNHPERVCSRCSSLLSLAASGSRYSLSTVGGFVPVGVPEEITLLCKLCLEDVPQPESTIISHCGCVFCSKCMTSYTEYEIMNGAYDISCPDSRCPMQGVMLTSEVEKLISDDLIDKHRKFRLNHEVAMDGSRAFCPRAGCETVCVVSGSTNPSGTSSGIGGVGNNVTPQPVFCPTCAHHFCNACTNKWHAGMDCAANMRQIALGAGNAHATGAEGLVGLVGDSDLIKWCPMCHVPIEKDEGCAQMMCKRCKHVFCWYCLASLDDDFLLRHYDKGPCKNKLGHSRASVIWHRAQVVGIFAGFGLLLLVASPLLLLAAPCIVCCKCRLCNTNSDKADIEETEGMDLETEYVGVGEIQSIATPITE